MATPTLYMGLPNPTPGGDSGVWANDLATCNTGFDTLAVSSFASVSASGSLSVYNGPALIQVTTAAGVIVLTLPDVTNGGANAKNQGRTYAIVKVDSGAGSVTVNPFSGGQTISGASSLSIAIQWTGYVIQSTSTGWVVTGILDAGISGIVSVSEGGTGANLSATGGTSFVVLQNAVGANFTVRQLAVGDLSTGTTGTGAVVLANAPTFTVNPTFASFTGSGGVVLATSPTVSAATLTGSITISGTASYTTANPTFFSAQGTGSKVQLSTGTTTTGDVVTYDATGNTHDSGTLLTSLAPLASPTFTGTAGFANVSITGTSSFTTANPTFFSATGSGAIVLATSPSLVTPNIGAASGASLATTTFVSVGTKITSYNGSNTAGQGVGTILAATSQKSETGADASVLSFTPPATVGTYRVSFVMSLSAATAATFGWTATWKDSNGNSQSPTNLSLNQTGAAGGSLTYTGVGAAGNYFGAMDIDIDNSATPIVVILTNTAGSITAKVSSTIVRTI